MDIAIDDGIAFTRLWRTEIRKLTGLVNNQHVNNHETRKQI